MTDRGWPPMDADAETETDHGGLDAPEAAPEAGPEPAPEAAPEDSGEAAGMPEATEGRTDAWGAPVDAEAAVAAPEESSRRGSRWWIVGIVVFGVVVVGGFVFRDSLTGGAGDIVVGDCFMLPRDEATGAEQEVVKEVQHRPCTESHDAEAFFVGNLSGAADAAFPAAAVVDDYVTAQCVPAFAAYTGSDLFEQQTLDAGYFSPTEESWRLGDREIMCYLTPLGGGTTSQSHKGTTP